LGLFLQLTCLKLHHKSSPRGTTQISARMRVHWSRVQNPQLSPKGAKIGWKLLFTAWIYSYMIAAKMFDLEWPVSQVLYCSCLRINLHDRLCLFTYCVVIIAARMWWSQCNHQTQDFRHIGDRHKPALWSYTSSLVCDLETVCLNILYTLSVYYIIVLGTELASMKLQTWKFN